VEEPGRIGAEDADAGQRHGAGDRGCQPGPACEPSGQVRLAAAGLRLPQGSSGVAGCPTVSTNGSSPRRPEFFGQLTGCKAGTSDRRGQANSPR
jgi:hypothetical protein